MRFTVSLREVEEMLAERGLDLTYETVRRWVTKFGPLFARELRKRRQRPTGRWHLGEMVVKIAASGIGSGGRWTTKARCSTSWCNHGATPEQPFGSCASSSRNRAELARGPVSWRNHHKPKPCQKARDREAIPTRLRILTTSPTANRTWRGERETVRVAPMMWGLYTL